MDREEMINALQRASTATQFDAVQQAINWLLSRSYLARERAQLANEAVEMARRHGASELLVAAALLLVPDGWNGNVGFGKGVARAVLFSPTFVVHGDEPPIEGEHEVVALALSIAAVNARA